MKRRTRLIGTRTPIKGASRSKTNATCSAKDFSSSETQTKLDRTRAKSESDGAFYLRKFKGFDETLCIPLWSDQGLRCLNNTHVAKLCDWARPMAPGGRSSLHNCEVVHWIYLT
jgi:hypothetical protein